MNFGWLRRGGGPEGKRFRHLCPGRHYRLARSFIDHDEREHSAGERWLYRDHSFLPYEDGLSLFFVTDRGEDRHIRLQWRPEAEGAIVEALETFLVPTEAPHRSAFASLREVGDTRLVAFDGVARTAFDWTDIRRVSAAIGQQHYDMTRCLTIDRARGTSVFLPEVESMWAPFLDGMARHLPGALSLEAWDRQLADEPERSVLLWRRPNVLNQLLGKRMP